MTYIYRPTTVYDLPLTPDAKILRPEFAMVRFPIGRVVDLGALCYLSREPAPINWKTIKSKKMRVGRRVDLSSLDSNRAERVRALITHISENLTDSGRRERTVIDATTRFVVFMSWADENNFIDAISNVEIARRAVTEYTQHIRERINTNAISLSSGVRQQSTVFIFLGEFLDVDTLTRGLNLLRINNEAKEKTIPPSENAQAKVLGLSNLLFEGLAKLAVDNKPYPYSLTVPKYLGYQDNTLWVFPSTVWFMSPQMLANRKVSKSPFWCFNYSDGRLTSLDEMQLIPNYAGNNNYTRKFNISGAKRKILSSNANPRHYQRLHQGMIAQRAFMLLFLAQTGMNWAQVVNLTWADKYEVDANHQVFRTIKWRANNREVSFELPVAFMPKFKRYLELRKYLLGGRSCNWLFFTQSIRRTVQNPTQIKFEIRSLYQTLLRIDPNIPVITSRQWRAAKSDWLIRNTDTSTTALILQNTEKTVLSAYAAGSETTQVEELTIFLDRVAETVLAKEHIVKDGVNRAVGICTDYGNPHQATKYIPIEADCRAPEGCLFCDKFKVHADEVDIRKLLSCRYCLRQTSSLVAENNEQYQTMLSPIFDRIEIILKELSCRDADLVIKISKDVEENGELDPYWSRKVEMLMDLGLVT